MAEPTSGNIQIAHEVLEMDHERETRQTETVASKEGSSSESIRAENAADPYPDPLSHLPERFRKELEAQATVLSRRVSFGVHEILAAVDRRSFSVLLADTRNYSCWLER
jgi:hypothetical protein